MAILSGFLLVMFVISAVLMVIIVLMQDEQGEGLGGIFGGGGAAPVTNRGGNVLTKTTVILAVVFFVSLFGYAWINRTPESDNIEAAARRLETESGEQFLEWWRTDEPVAVPEEGLSEPEAIIEPATEDSPDTSDE